MHAPAHETSNFCSHGDTYAYTHTHTHTRIHTCTCKHVKRGSGEEAQAQVAVRTPSRRLSRRRVEDMSESDDHSVGRPVGLKMGTFTKPVGAAFTTIRRVKESAKKNVHLPRRERVDTTRAQRQQQQQQQQQQQRQEEKEKHQQ
ncbi:unnamed protein product [Protopolystoma xenopodis]|uniref:Uncharacterized protein n=1 Tax=Protopolystoma xenopodis TaxID=117903 RepID=A0A3S5BI91_9PLAT|nr:unnamed protein product [Protopolystoma xenopodis]